MNVFISISHKHKEIHFYESWEMAKNKGGKKKKFRGTDRSAIINYILNETREISPESFKTWNAPDWIKEIHSKVYSRHKVLCTLYGNEILIKFDNYPTITIDKNSIFFSLYDKYTYIYEKIVYISQISKMTKIEIITDLVDLLRLNRLYWNKMPVEVFVTCGEVDILLKEKLGGNKN